MVVLCLRSRFVPQPVQSVRGGFANPRPVSMYGPVPGRASSSGGEPSWMPSRSPSRRFMLAASQSRAAACFSVRATSSSPPVRDMRGEVDPPTERRAASLPLKTFTSDSPTPGTDRGQGSPCWSTGTGNFVWPSVYCHHVQSSHPSTFASAWVAAMSEVYRGSHRNSHRGERSDLWMLASSRSRRP